MQSGWFRISKKCSTTTPCWVKSTCERIRSPGNLRHAEVARETLITCAVTWWIPPADFIAAKTPTAKVSKASSTSGLLIEVGSRARSTTGAAILPDLRHFREAGNFEGKNIPNLPRSLDAWADELSIDLSSVERSNLPQTASNFGWLEINVCIPAATTKS